MMADNNSGGNPKLRFRCDTESESCVTYTNIFHYKNINETATLSDYEIMTYMTYFHEKWWNFLNTNGITTG